MSINRTTRKRLTKEYQMLFKRPNQNVIATPNKKDILTWHFLIYGLEDPYKGGFYIGHIYFPQNYPFSPPHFCVNTPQGRFKIGLKICMSFSGHHKESWSAAWTIEKMLLGLISFMHSSEKTLNGIVTTDSQKKKLAAESHDYNLKNFNEI